jgi:hypothetical protein
MTTKRSHHAESNLCRFSFSEGRRCRMLRISRSGLCLFHARDEQQLLECRRLGSELSASLTGHFHTAADINHVLGKVFTALAQGRITPRTATVLAYIGQLLLQSLPAVKAETQFKYTYNAWSRMIDNATPLSDPPDLPANSPSGNPPTSAASDSRTDMASPKATSAVSPEPESAEPPAGAQKSNTLAPSHASQDLQHPEEPTTLSDQAELSEIEEPQPV